MAQEKQYGLILPSSKSKGSTAAPATTSKKKNVFGEADSSDEESAVDWVRQSLKKQSHGSMQQKQSMKVMKKALEDDPSVYEYDEVYDEMERKKEEVKKKEKGDKKPKYIEGLLKTAKQRELENELRRERLAQKEREDEGDEFEDKEAFVTAAYKKKMEDVRKQQEEQANIDAVDDMTEVTKQNDLSGFYRYLYREKMKEETNSSSKEPTTTEENKNPDPVKTEPQSDSEETEKVKHSPPPRESSRTPDRSSRSPETENRRGRRGDDRHDRGDTHRRRRSRSGSHGREKRRRYESPPRDHRRSDRRDRSRSRDRSNKNRHERHRRSRSRSTDRDRRRDNRPERSGGGPSDRSSGRYFDREDKTKDNRPRRDPHDTTEKDSKSTKASSSKDSKIKIIQKENWYDFDVEIEREVNKDFYAKRTVGKVFEEALQKYLLRKGPEQELDPKSKYA